MSSDDTEDRASSTSLPGGAGRLVIEHREPKRRRSLLWLLIASVFLNMILFAGRNGIGISRLEERYVAGATLSTKSKIAIIDIHGTINDTSVEHILKQIRQARDDNSVLGVVLRVDSPGGTVTGSDQIWREVSGLKAADKPVVASFGGIAASGGYYVSAPADLIFAEPTCLTGSIGVKLELPQLAGLLEKVGVQFATITTGEWKDSASMYKPMTDVERKRWQILLDVSHARFVRVVAQGRKLTLSAAEALANGKILSVDEAIQGKLVDRVGYLDDAIAYLQTKLGLETPRVIRYSKPMSLTDVLLPGLLKPPDVHEQILERLQTPKVMFIAY